MFTHPWGVFFFFFSFALAAAPNDRPACRNIPGDPGWPTPADWAKLNATVGGRLIATVPLAALCFEQGYDAQRCDYLKEQWGLAPIK
jgi:hypothetical protein